MSEIKLLKKYSNIFIVVYILLYTGILSVLINLIENMGVLFVCIVFITALCILICIKTKQAFVEKLLKSKELKINSVRDDEFDFLTGTYTKRAFERKFQEKIKAYPNAVGGMLFIDIDNLKYINDNYGHDIGDKFILKMSEILNYFHEFDGMVSRISGDEFLVYLHDTHGSEDELLEVFKGLYKYSENYEIMTPDGMAHKIRFTCGVSWYPKDGTDFTKLYKFADFALYEAKNNQRGSLFEFSEKAYDKQFFSIQNSDAINKFIEEKLIHFAYQPIVDLKTGEVFAYEALMRSKMENFKNPYEILRVATKQAKLPQLEALVAFTVYEDIAQNEEAIGGRKIFLNSIPSQVLDFEDGELLAKKYSKYFKQVVVEITEEENENQVNMDRKLEFCKHFGIGIAVDDFGNGFSNEVRVIEIVPDIVKIDMRLIQGIHKNSDKQYIVANIVKFCRDRGIKVVAEGIEEKEELEYIIKLGIEYVQGYYLGKPEFGYNDIPKNIKEEILELNDAK